MMRVLSGIKHVKEVGLETYAANNLTKAMADPVTEGSVKIWYARLVREVLYGADVTALAMTSPRGWR